MRILLELSLPFVQACSKIERAKTRELKSKQLIYLSRPEGRTFVVKRGYVRLVSVDSAGRLLTRMLIGKGSIFGELPYQPSVSHIGERAVSSGMACVVEAARQDFEEHAATSGLFQSLLLQTITAQYTALDRRMQWQLVHPMRNRVAAALLDLICFAGGRCSHGHLIDVRITHEELSELVVAARPVVSDILVGLKSQGIIDYTRGYICILSLDALQDIVDMESL
jgi:CRP/FNR family transcriptional regulator, cyclic AMP receptor protein